jgi:hypothetical protein
MAQPVNLSQSMVPIPGSPFRRKPHPHLSDESNVPGRGRAGKRGYVIEESRGSGSFDAALSAPAPKSLGAGLMERRSNNI